MESTFKIINSCMSYTRTKWWLDFGGLWGLIKNNGTIPDGDLDICCLYPAPWQKIRKMFEGRGYSCTRVMLNDADNSQAVYMSFDHPKFLHICLSIWYPARGVRWYCHDNAREISGEGIPSIGYYFKGMPAELVEGDDKFRMVEWPGINQQTKVSVPVYPGSFMDYKYPSWAYTIQRYNINSKHTVESDKMVSIHKGGAMSPHQVHLNSIADFNRDSIYNAKAQEGTRNYVIQLKNGK
jgi:hypothetical protein